VSKELRPWNEDISRAYVLSRVTLGLNICLHGVVRLIKGLHSFAESLVPLFAKTPLPSWIVYDFLYVLPILEALWVQPFCLGWRRDLRSWPARSSC